MVNAAHGSPRAATSDPARVGDSVDRHPRERRVRRLQAKRCRRGSERKRQAWAWPGAVLHRTETVGATAKSTRPVPGRRMCSPVLLGKSSTAQLPQIRAKDAPAGAILPARYRRLASADRRATHPLPGGSGCVARPSRASGRSSFRGHRCPPGSRRRNAWGSACSSANGTGCPPSGQASRSKPFLHRNESAGTARHASASRSASLTWVSSFESESAEWLHPLVAFGQASGERVGNHRKCDLEHLIAGTRSDKNSPTRCAENNR